MYGISLWRYEKGTEIKVTKKEDSVNVNGTGIRDLHFGAKKNKLLKRVLK